MQNDEIRLDAQLVKLLDAVLEVFPKRLIEAKICLLYTSDAADEL